MDPCWVLSIPQNKPYLHIKEANKLKMRFIPFFFWNLLGTYAFLATFSNFVSTQQESKCKSVCLSIMLSPPKPLDEI